MSDREPTVPARNDPPQRKRRASIGAQRNPASAAAILQAASDLLSERGYRDFSIEAVARRAGAGKPTIYRWWPNKAALLFEVYERDKAGGITLPDTGSLEDDLAALMRGIWRHWRGGPAGRAFASLLAESQSDAHGPGELVARLRPIRQRYVEAVLARAAERGEIDREYIGAIADLFIGFNWNRLLTGRLDDESAIAPAVAVLVHGARRR